MTEQDFENLWGLILVGCLCGGKGKHLWDVDPDDFLVAPNFNDYMTQDRFKKLRAVSTCAL